MTCIRFKPLYQERVWGGRDFESRLGRELPAAGIYGESWEVVDRPEAQSVVSEGNYVGWTLRELIERAGAEVMGPAWDTARPFPILVKWLDCQDRLSLQVHPPAAVAPRLQGEPKTECWYIAECAEDAALIAGLRSGVKREAFEQALEAQSLESLCHRFPVKPGMHIFIPSGRIHAIDAGNLILEIQQNSDTTYRVYDWGRLGLDGQPRALHVAQSLESIDFEDFEPEPVRPSPGEQTVADCGEFRTRKLELAEGETLSLPAGEQPVLLGMIDGVLIEESMGTRVERGQNILVPYASGACFRADSAATFLVTDHFNQ